MEKKKPAKNESNPLLKRQLKVFDQLLAETRAQILEERAQGPDFEAELTRRLDHAQADLAVLRKKLTAAKAQSKKRKREIDAWKLWYNGLPNLNKSAELAQLNAEIGWRAAEIAAREAEISALYLELLAAEGACEKIKIQIEALRAGASEGPVEEDARIRSLLEERALLKAGVARQQ